MRGFDMAPIIKPQVVTITRQQLAAVHLALSFYAGNAGKLAQDDDYSQWSGGVALVNDAGRLAEYALKRLGLGELPSD